MAEQKTNPAGVLDQVRERVDSIKYSDSLQDWHDLVHLLVPLVEAAEAMHEVGSKRLGHLSSGEWRHVSVQYKAVLADLQQEKAGD